MGTGFKLCCCGCSLRDLNSVILAGEKEDFRGGWAIRLLCREEIFARLVRAYLLPFNDAAIAGRRVVDVLKGISSISFFPSPASSTRVGWLDYDLIVRRFF